MKPIKSELITIRKCEQLTNSLLIAIDAGNVFTKVLFLNKSNKEQLLNDNEDSLNLELSLFHIEDFMYALEWIRDHAYIPEDDSYRVHITGSPRVQYQNLINSILNRKILSIDHFKAVASGCKFAIQHIGFDNLRAKPVEFYKYGEVYNEKLAMIVEALKSKFTSKQNANKVMEPCLVYVQGHSSACYYYDENGSCEYFGTGHLGTETLCGLSKCLLNTNNCDEVIELASKGNESNVDTLLKEMLDSSADSPYGRFPPEIPLFPLGKCVDYNLGLESLKKEDVACSLLGLQIRKSIEVCTTVCSIKKVSKVYICGSLVESEVYRRQLLRLLSIPFVLIKPDIVNFTESALIGALVFDENYDQKYLKHF